MAEASTFYLEIITPERQFYIGPAEALVFPAVDGEMGRFCALLLQYFSCSS